MPEFILDHGTDEAARQFAALDAFTQGYIEALFFTETGPSDDDDMQNATFAYLAPETLQIIISDCAAFQTANAALLDEAYGRDDYSETQAGGDYWCTRNGHGVGFWARKQLEPDSAEYSALTNEMIANRDNKAAWSATLAKRDVLQAASLGERLSVACRYSPVDVYLGDDGRLYI